MKKIGIIELDTVLEMLIPSRLSGSTARAVLAVQTNIKTIKDQYLKSMIRKKKLIILYIAILATSSTHAKDFGIKGHTYKIIEQPFLNMIDERLKKVDIQKEQERMTTTVKDRINNPPAVDCITPATNNRVSYFDPTFALDKDIILPCGKILYKAGTKVNPLEHMELNRRMFFIDAREKVQIKWLKAQLKDQAPNKSTQPETQIIEDRIILIGGSPLKLKEDLGEPHKDHVYFDQNGELTTKFGIKASPAQVEQEGLKLKIEEIGLSK